MPDFSNVIFSSLKIAVLDLIVIAILAYSDSTSGNTLSINNFTANPLNYVDYMYCLLILILGILSLTTVKGRNGLNIVVLSLMEFTVFCGFFVSGIYAIAVAFEIQCCFDIKLMALQHFENTDDQYVSTGSSFTGDGLANCKNFENHGTCNTQHYILIGAPWLFFNILGRLMTTQMAHIRQHALEVDNAHNEYVAYAERTNLVAEGSDVDENEDHIELAFQDA